MTRLILPLVSLVVSLACWLVVADQDPDINCPSGLTNLANGFRTECDVASIEGLQGRPASQIMYEIIMESNLDNSTYFENEKHVTCLFQNSSFGLSGTHIGAGPLTIDIPTIKYDGTLCLYVADVTEGGLDLGQIRNLTREFILTKGCNKCGWITANYFSHNLTQEGFVRIDWRKNSNCIENCIDPANDLKEVDRGKGDSEGAALRAHGGYLGGLLLLPVIAMMV